jgi:hypothetical protein
MDKEPENAVDFPAFASGATLAQAYANVIRGIG